MAVLDWLVFILTNDKALGFENRVVGFNRKGKSYNGNKTPRNNNKPDPGHSIEIFRVTCLIQLCNM